MWKTEFFRLLTSLRAEERNAAFDLKEHHFPSSLFKYRGASDLAFEAVTTGSIWLAAPRTLNDPCDSSLYFDDREIFRVIFRDLSTDPSNRWTESELDRICSSTNPIDESLAIVLAKYPPLPDEYIASLRAELSEQSGSIGLMLNAHLQNSSAICAFSTEPLSLIMWSHYADSHQGFCIEYPFDGLDANDYRRRHTFPVIYQEESFDLLRETEFAIRLDANLDIESLFVSAAIRKSTEWSYEQEWRFIGTCDPGALGSCFPMPKPSRFILGSRMKDAARERLLSLARTLGVPCFATRLAEGKFRLELLEIR
jgi:hypothetical protein